MKVNALCTGLVLLAGCVAATDEDVHQNVKALEKRIIALETHAAALAQENTYQNKILELHQSHLGSLNTTIGYMGEHLEIHDQINRRVAEQIGRTP